MAGQEIGQVALEGQRYNLVTYTGKSQTVGEAFASLANQSFIQVVHVVDTEYQEVTCRGTSECTTSTKMMIPGDYYWIFVHSDCIWTFKVTPDEPEVSQFKIADYKKV